jgi:hypothetical protein
MRKILLLSILLLGTLVSKSQTFTFSKMNTQLPTLGIQSVDVDGEVTITDSTITQTLMGITSTTPVIKINDVEYKIKIGDIDIRYKFAPISQLVKDTMKSKKGKWLVKEMEFATHVFITDMVDRFTNQHTIISMYLTPKL